MDFDQYQDHIDQMPDPQRGESREYAIDSFATNLLAASHEICDKHIRARHQIDPDAFSEDPADILWLVARVASACDLRLADLAHRVTDRTDTPTD